MALYLGLDTSNYTTSAALYDSVQKTLIQEKQLLPVKPGEAGLRQSDAVFHHTKQLPQLLEQLLPQATERLAAIGVSTAPRTVAGSYMPCFLCGEGAGRMLAAVGRIPLFRTSHQVGHILAALYGASALHLLSKPFLAFHVSGGTTDCVLCQPDEKQLLQVMPVSGSLDLKAGQAIDRAGLMLGLQFPCGPALEQLAGERVAAYHPRPVLKGLNCCLSGVENQCRAMLEQGKPDADAAAFCLAMITETICGMTAAVLSEYGALPILYAGGVMSNRHLQSCLKQRFSSQTELYTAPPLLSSDNAAGLAVYAALQQEREELV